jgi:hypothetical protein
MSTSGTAAVDFSVCPNTTSSAIARIRVSYFFILDFLYSRSTSLKDIVHYLDQKSNEGLLMSLRFDRVHVRGLPGRIDPEYDPH